MLHRRFLLGGGAALLSAASAIALSILAGHTHGGQVRLPWLTRRVVQGIGSPYIGGYIEIGESILYVNAGIGHTRAGMRYGRAAGAEVALFDLVPICA